LVTFFISYYNPALEGGDSDALRNN
jgi:hypothetical protein